jgi:hypothetical protein
MALLGSQFKSAQGAQFDRILYLKYGFGDFYMEYLCHEHNGQLSIPEPICNMMASLIWQTPKDVYARKQFAST